MYKPHWHLTHMIFERKEIVSVPYTIRDLLWRQWLDSPKLPSPTSKRLLESLATSGAYSCTKGFVQTRCDFPWKFMPAGQYLVDR